MCLQKVADLQGDNDDQTVGVSIALRAMEAPLRQIVENAGEEGSVVVDKVKQGTGNFGYNAGTGEYGDMIDMGILDPAKVTRTALQAAASIAGLMITTEAMVSDAADEGGAAARRLCLIWAAWADGHGWYGRHDVSRTL